MNQPIEPFGTVFVGSSVALLARVAYADHTLVAPADIASVAYTIEECDPCGVAPPTPIAGHTAVSVTPGALLASSLQTGPPWDVDEVGYNFFHEIDVTTSPAFTKAGRRYRVAYVLTPTSGQPMVVRFLVEAL